jgi:hypothetical protein
MALQQFRGYKHIQRRQVRVIHAFTHYRAAPFFLVRYRRLQSLVELVENTQYEISLSATGFEDTFRCCPKFHGDFFQHLIHEFYGGGNLGVLLLFIGGGNKVFFDETAKFIRGSGGINFADIIDDFLVTVNNGIHYVYYNTYIIFI